MVWYMRGVVHVDPGAITVRAPPPDPAFICDLNGDVNPDAVRRHIATLSDYCPLFDWAFLAISLFPARAFAPRLF